MADVTMAQARYIDAEGREQIVQLPGSVLNGGNVHFDAAMHKSHLHCLYCDVKVNYDRGSETVVGGLKGPSPHFQRNAKQQHDDQCLMGLRINEGREAKEYDYTKGYRIHLNMLKYSELFENAAYPYARDEDKKLIVLDDSIRDMEPFSVKSINDFLRLMRRGDSERLRNSVVIRKDKLPILWPDFFVRYARSQGAPEHRYINLVENLKKIKTQLVLMEVFNEKAVVQLDLFKRTKAELRKVEYRDHYGKPQEIVTRVWLDDRDTTQLSDAFGRAGSYLVFGEARLKTKSYALLDTHFIDISIRDRRQVQPVNIDELAQKAKANHAKRDARKLSGPTQP